MRCPSSLPPYREFRIMGCKLADKLSGHSGQRGEREAIPVNDWFMRRASERAMTCGKKVSVDKGDARAPRGLKDGDIDGGGSGRGTDNT